ncbi:MAG: hypothetical protein K2H81_06995 [Alistipes sp.]|nr:hypothetical protein [Alistipes sp.]
MSERNGISASRILRPLNWMLLSVSLLGMVRVLAEMIRGGATQSGVLLAVTFFLVAAGSALQLVTLRRQARGAERRDAEHGSR